MTYTSKIKIFFLVVSSVLSGSTFAQHSLNVAGNTAVINGLTFDYSIGEMTLITTEHNTNLVVTQGLLQPSGPDKGAPTSPAQTATAITADRVKVYPNPTMNILFVESEGYSNAEISYQLFDAGGKVVLSKNLMQKKGFNKFDLDMQALAAGAYYLIIRKPGLSGEFENYSYKIQKVN